MLILDLISRVYLPSFVTMLPKYLKHSTFSSCFWYIIIVTGNGCRSINLKTQIGSTSPDKEGWGQEHEGDSKDGVL